MLTFFLPFRCRISRGCLIFKVRVRLRSASGFSPLILFLSPNINEDTNLTLPILTYLFPMYNIDSGLHIRESIRHSEDSLPFVLTAEVTVSLSTWSEGGDEHEQPYVY